MRAPDERFINYSDAQWRAIEAIGIDPATVVCDFSNLDGQPIRRWLEEAGAGYVSLVGCTRRETRHHQRKLQAALVAARTALDDPSFFLLDGRQARMALDTLIAKVAAPPKRRGNKAQQRHIRFWGDLAKLYVHINRPHRASTKQLIAFLLACSKPVFPSETTPDAVATFAYRFGK
jgi:hypothetical protein